MNFPNLLPIPPLLLRVPVLPVLLLLLHRRRRLLHIHRRSVGVGEAEAKQQNLHPDSNLIKEHLVTPVPEC
jgi:hypothetical protein